MEVLVRCEPSGVMRLLATSKALTNMANESETTIYRKLYHNLLVKGAVGAHVIHSPVWKKGKALISYPRSAPLPAAVVYSWKVSRINLHRADPSRICEAKLTRFLCSPQTVSVRQHCTIRTSKGRKGIGRPLQCLCLRSPRPEILRRMWSEGGKCGDRGS